MTKLCPLMNEVIQACLFNKHYKPAKFFLTFADVLPQHTCHCPQAGLRTLPSSTHYFWINRRDKNANRTKLSS